MVKRRKNYYKYAIDIKNTSGTCTVYAKTKVGVNSIKKQCKKARFRIRKLK